MLLVIDDVNQKEPSDSFAELQILHVDNIFKCRKLGKLEFCEPFSCIIYGKKCGTLNNY